MKKYIWLIASSMMLTALAAEGVSVKAKSPASIVKSGYTESYDFRGVKLGITLSEFRKLMPIPGRKQISKSGDYADFDILTICTGDSEANDSLMKILVEPRKGTAESGGTTCLWAYQDPNEFISRYKVADFSLGEYSSSNYGFNFVMKHGDIEPVLYSIEIVSAANDNSLVSSGLTKKFGNPSKESVNVVQNEMGAKFDSIFRIWENDSSKITLEQRSISVHQGILVYELKSYARYVNDLLSSEAPKM